MATSAFQLFGELKVDSRDLKTGLHQGEASLKRFTNQLDDAESRSMSFAKSLGAIGDTIRSVGVGLTAAVTAPLVAIGAAATSSAVDFDTLRTQLKAATGDTASASAKFAELNALAQSNAGVLTKGAVATYAFLKPLGFMDDTINETIKAFGKLKAANPEVDLQRMGTNLSQLFDQGFEQQDLKELFGNFPRAGEILKQAFKLSGSDRKTVADEMKGLMANGLTREDFFAGFAGGVNADKFLAGVTDPVAVRFEKLKERIMLALEPLGVVILGVFERIAPPLTALIERISAGFTALSPTMQTVVLALAGIAAAAGPVLIVFGAVIGAVAQIVTGFAALVPSAGVIGIIAAAVAGLAIAMGPVIAIAALFYQAWANNWELAKQVFNDGVAYVTGVVNTGLAALQGFWAEHGNAITAWATAWWTTLSNVFTAALDIISSYVKLGLQIIQGDWQGAWQSVLDITAQVWTALAQLVSSAIATTWKLIEAAIPILVQGFVWLGTQILSVVTKAVAMVIDVIVNLPSYLIALVPKLISAGAQIGSAIWEGIKSGLSGGLLGGGQGLNVGGAIGGSSPIGDLVNQFKSLFSNLSGPSLATTGPATTFLAPVIRDAVKTTTALNNVKTAVNAVKNATSTAANQAKVSLSKTREARIGNNIVQVTDYFLRYKGQSAEEASREAFAEAMKGAIPDQKLEITIADPNGRTAIAATSSNVNARYR